MQQRALMVSLLRPGCHSPPWPLPSAGLQEAGPAPSGGSPPLPDLG